MSTLAKSQQTIKETNSVLQIAYAASVAIPITTNNTLAKVAQLTGNASISLILPTPAADSNRPFVGDKLDINFSSDGSDRTVTFSTGFSTTGTLVVSANKKATASFVFDGAAFVEISRSVTA